ncbi:EpsG family protein [uncultured Microbulbifer sp.]|uniref:EpsG family protein n=1 Tax=uncultured Microbulbifer sp. TaxID=348147 RepID=UPI00261FAB97|nr:EpsG family protein [uncultured Microbulbifer sp.]
MYALCVFFLALSVVVGGRDVSVGADTENYTYFFNNIKSTLYSTRFELLFKYLAYGVGLLTNNAKIFFVVIFLLFNFTYFYFYLCISDERQRIVGLFILTGLMLSSSWYVAATINGLRQGLSLPVLYLSLFFFSKRKFLTSVLFFITSLGFHKTSVLVSPFFFLIFIPSWLVLFSFIVCSLFYLFGITEILVSMVSDLLSISLYEDITNYASGSSNWFGLQYKFYLYTVFWGVGFYILRKYVKEPCFKTYMTLWKFYCILMMPYFFFGFAAYSNRYAFIGWLFLPIIQAFFIASSKIGKKIKLMLGLVFLVFGLFSYSHFILGVWY